YSTYSTSSSTPNTLDQDDDVSPGIKPEDKPITKAKCKVEGCQTQYVWHGSTTNMVNHLRDIHHITKTSLEHSSVEELKKSSQQTIEITLSKPYSASRQQKLTQDIIIFFISCTLPLSLIENKNFRIFLNSFDPRYKPLCVNTIKNKIVNETNHTAQSIKNEFRIYDLTLGIIEMGAYKNADDIINTIEPMLEEFGLNRSKILSITTDNVSNVKLAVTRLSARLSVSDPIVNIFCAAHMLQLSVEA
ncbi:21215_t:CDS:2, partial [Cetraspora pellucida]